MKQCQIVLVDKLSTSLIRVTINFYVFDEKDTNILWEFTRSTKNPNHKRNYMKVPQPSKAKMKKKQKTCVKLALFLLVGCAQVV